MGYGLWEIGDIMGHGLWVMGNGLSVMNYKVDIAPLSRLHQIFFVCICNYDNYILTEV